MRRFVWVVALLGVVVSESTASASITVYTTSAAFTAAVGGPLNTENFNAGPTGSAPITVGAIGISNTGSSLLGVFPNLFSGSGNSVQWTFSGQGPMTFTFSSPITAFSADFFDVGTVGATTLSVALNNGDNAALFTGFTGGFGNQQFRGFISTTPFTTITFSNTQPGDFVELDNVQFANNIPEPATLAVFGLMAGGAFGVRRRLKASA
jgi:hypothetical protein